MRQYCLVVTDDAGNPLAAAFLSHAIEDAEVAKAIKVRLEAQAPLIIRLCAGIRQPARKASFLREAAFASLRG